MIVVDGFIAVSLAVLVASRLQPAVLALRFAHRPDEQAHARTCWR